MTIPPLVPFLLGLVLAPLLPGVIDRVKAFFGGRRGRPLLQRYRDFAKLMGKGCTYSTTTTWVFQAAPAVSLAGSIAALGLVPLGDVGALAAFPGDFMVALYLLGLARFALALAALDTGSAFEGMGASRDLVFGWLAEPVVFLAFLVLMMRTGETSLSGILGALDPADWRRATPILVLLAASLLAVVLVECCRIPIDDPNTHLELTMVHEVIVLDHGGPDLGMILYASWLKMWVLLSVATGILLPTATGPTPAALGMHLGCILGLAGTIGLIESSMARLPMPQVPRYLVFAGSTAALALILEL